MNIEERLRSVKKAAPRRPVDVAFTSNVLNKINAKQEKGNMITEFFKKPLGAVLSITLVLASGATTFAAVTNWPAIVSIITGEQMLGSGARIVKIETEGCNPVDDSKTSSKRISYYEIRKDSSLTNEKAVDMMRGICEEERAQGKVGEFAKQVGGAVHSTSIYKVTEISRNGIIMLADAKYEGPRKGLVQIYTNIASDVRVNDGTSDISFDQVKVGDSVVLVIQDQRGISTEMQGYTEDVASMQVKVILKVPALTGSPDLFYEYMSKDFVRVEPSEDGKSLERVYEFH